MSSSESFHPPTGGGGGVVPLGVSSLEEEADKLCTLEAEAAVAETAFGVRDIRIAEGLPFSETLAYLNLTTLEGEKLCVEISAAGFRPVGVLCVA